MINSGQQKRCDHVELPELQLDPLLFPFTGGLGFPSGIVVLFYALLSPHCPARGFNALPQAGTYRLIEMSRACSRVFATS